MQVKNTSGQTFGVSGYGPVPVDGVVEVSERKARLLVHYGWTLVEVEQPDDQTPQPAPELEVVTEVEPTLLPALEPGVEVAAPTKRGRPRKGG